MIYMIYTIYTNYLIPLPSPAMAGTFITSCP